MMMMAIVLMMVMKVVLMLMMMRVAMIMMRIILLANTSSEAAIHTRVKRHFVSSPFFSLDIVPDDDGNDGDVNDGGDANDVEQCGHRTNLFNFWGGILKYVIRNDFNNKDDDNDDFALLLYDHESESPQPDKG